MAGPQIESIAPRDPSLLHKKPKSMLNGSASFKASSGKKHNLLNGGGGGGAAVYPLSRLDPDVDDLISLLHGSDPVRVELSRLENELREKDRELGDAQAEIKALKYSERLKEKAVEETTDELKKVDEKLKAAEALLESKNLEIKKLNDEKKAAFAAQFAAEATLRRVHAAQKDDDMPPIEAIIAPLEAELKLARLEAAKFQEDNRALDRLTKSKEAALLEAEKTIEIALAKASLVDDLQNKNQELMKQIEICQEENKILDKLHRQKVAEVEKLTQTVRELEEAILAAGATANAVRDYKRRLQEMQEEKRMLEREAARAKVSANRVATVVANEWKDGNDKVMPVKQWLEERKFLQGEMQQLRDKLAVAERTAKAESQLKEKYQLRFKVLEDKLKASSNSRAQLDGKILINRASRCQSLGGAEAFSKLHSNGPSSKKVTAGPVCLLRSNSASMLLRQAKPSSSFDGGSRSLDKLLESSSEKDDSPGRIDEERATICGAEEATSNGNAQDKPETGNEDLVSGTLYDILQKEVIILRRACRERDQSIKEKDDAIEMLAKKVDTLNKAMEVEAKRMRREFAVMEKEVANIRGDRELDNRTRRHSAMRGAVHCVQPNLARNGRNM
ncbi:hypothetical protein MLD38_030995 [Melastoma candidum]|uniref:Uncharacterized protein n=1 Tax=Melastoma candidum TaxID=119954 RepID=A0ACB9MNC1_9MYRT|nr:hypothetical protein MLD38_030995 [Melastoma candidum]